MKNKVIFSVLFLVSVSLALGTVLAADAPANAPMQPVAQVSLGGSANASSQNNGNLSVNGQAKYEYNGEMMQNGSNYQQGERVMMLERVQNRFELRFGNYSINCTNCNLTQERVRAMDQNQSYNGSAQGPIRAMLSNGRNAEIKVMPDVASQVALNRLRLRVCNETNNCSIQLREVGSGNSTALAYQMNANTTAKVFGLFRTRANVQTQVNAETGDVLSTKRPWWSFMASWKN